MMPDSISIPLCDTGTGFRCAWWKNATNECYDNGDNMHRFLEPHKAVLNTRWDTITFKSEADYLLFLLKYS